MARPSKYPPELRERAVLLVIESRGQYPNEAAAIRSVAAKLGIAAATRRESTLPPEESSLAKNSGCGT